MWRQLHNRPTSKLFTLNAFFLATQLAIRSPYSPPVPHNTTHTHTHTHPLSLSLSIYIYIYIYPCITRRRRRKPPEKAKEEPLMEHQRGRSAHQRHSRAGDAKGCKLQHRWIRAAREPLGRYNLERISPISIIARARHIEPLKLSKAYGNFQQLSTRVRNQVYILASICAF